MALEAAVAAAMVGDVAAYARLPDCARKNVYPMTTAASHRQYELLEWCWRNMMPKWNWKWCRTALAGLERESAYKYPAEWFARKFPEQRRLIMRFVAVAAANRGDIEALEWADKMGGGIDANLFYRALVAGHLHVLDWYWQNDRCPIAVDITFVVDHSWETEGKLPEISASVLNWLSDRGLEAMTQQRRTKLLVNALDWGFTPMLDWLERLGAAGPEAVAAVRKNQRAKGPSETMKWLKQRGL